MNPAPRTIPAPRPSRRQGLAAAALVMVFLAASLLAVAPAATAQVVLTSHVAEVREDGSDRVLVDLEGDAGPFGADAGMATPAGEVARYVDILDLRIGHETVSEYGFTLRLAGWSELAQTAARAAIGYGSATCELEYTFNDREEFEYEVYVDIYDITGSDPSLWGYVDRYDRSGERSRYDSVDLDSYEFAFDGESGTLDIRIQKYGTPVYPSYAPPAEGDDLQISAAICYSRGLYTDYRDRLVAPQDFAFPFQQPGPGDTVKVYFGEPLQPVVVMDDAIAAERGEMPEPNGYAGADPSANEPAWLTPGVQTVLPFHLVNTVAQKRIVALEARVVDGDGAALEGWNLTVAPHLELKGDEVRGAKLIVTPPRDAQLGQSVQLVIDATVVGRDELGRAARPGDLLPQLSPTTNQLFFHSRSDGAALRTGEEQVDWMFRRHVIGWSLLRDDPEWTDEPVRILRQGGFDTSFALPPLPSPTKVDPDGDIEVQLAFEGGGTVEVSVWVGTGSGDRLFSFRDTIEANGPVIIKRQVPEDIQHRLPAGTTIYANLYARGNFLQGSIDAATTGDLGVAFDTAQSHVTLPLVKVSQEEVQVTDGRFVPSLALVPGQDSEEYMNPGKVYTFDLMLANEGVETDDLVVDVDIGNATRDGWTAAVVPGKAFRVSPGNATKFGMRIVAPPDAQEQDIVEITVRARSTHDDMASATLRLGVIVTTQVDRPEKEYEADEDQIQPLDLETEESPAIGPAAGVALIGLAALLGRRRR